MIESSSSDDETTGRASCEISSTVSSSSSIPPELILRVDNLMEPIAIIGIGCRLPGDIVSPSSLWHHVMSGEISNSNRVPSSRFNIDGYYHPNKDRPGSISVSGGYFLNSNLQEFDPTVFGISPVEALWMEPQQRKLLEVVYEAFENGGVTLDSIAGTATGCFVGNFTADYQDMILKDPDFRHSYAATGIDPGMCSNRISNAFNLKGPSLVLNTACSSTMYALHVACSSLLTGGCEGAIVAGTNLILTIDQHMNTAKLGILSPSNQCHAFDASADGYGRAEGVGALYIKRLSDALKNNDPVRAVIRSTAVNTNGKVPEAGITSPNIDGQVAVIKAAHERAGLDPALTTYIEAHGTGTAVGDPVEARAISLAMREKGSSNNPIMIGSVKPNVGHSEAASSIPTIIKSVLATEIGIIPGTAGVSKRNPNILWDDWNVKLVTEPTPFPSERSVRRIGVNAFGYGGTNAHCIIENVTETVPHYNGHKSAIQCTNDEQLSPGFDRPYLLTFSAHDKATLARNIAAYAQMSHEPELLDLSYTLATHRTKHKYRAFTVANRQSFRSQLEKSMVTATEFVRAAVIAFVFTGQGAQWAKMGITLLDSYPVFASTIQQLDIALASLQDPPDWRIYDILLEETSRSRINKPQFSQPICTAIQIGLVNLLRSWNVHPVASVGHSSGEIAASYVAGFLSAEEAIITAYYRGTSMLSATENGAMLAVGLGGEDVKKYVERFEGRIIIACYNSPKSVTLSGDVDAIEEIEAILTSERIFARILKTGGKGYHNRRHMADASHVYEKYMDSAASLERTEKLERTRMVSSVTGKLVTNDEIRPDYWMKNLVSPVLFNQALLEMLRECPLVNTIIEVGPHSALAGPVRDTFTHSSAEKIQYIPTLLRGENDTEQLLSLAGTLWVNECSMSTEDAIKVEINTEDGKIVELKPTLLVDLPTYQWNYTKNTWLEPLQSRDHRSQAQPRHDILGRRIIGPSPMEPVWQNVLRHKDLPWLKHHSLGGEAVLAGAAYFAMAFEALRQINSENPEPVSIYGFRLRDVSIQSALVIPENLEGIMIVSGIRPSEAIPGSASIREYIFSVASQSQNAWKTHMTAFISLNPRKRGQTPSEIPSLPQCTSGRSWYERLSGVGFDYGQSFQGLSGVRSDGVSHHATADSTIKTTSGLMDGESEYFLHPASMDIPIQLIMAAIYAGKLNDVTCGMTVSTSREVLVWIPTSEQLEKGLAKAHAWTTSQGQRVFLANSQLAADDGQLIVDICDMRCTSYEAACPMNASETDRLYPYTKMVWKEDVDQLSFPDPLSQEKISIRGFIDLMIHKNSALRILNVDSQLAPDLLERPGVVTITRDELKEHSRDNSAVYNLVLSYDVTLDSSSDLSILHSLLVEKGRAVIAKITETEGTWHNTLRAASFSGTDFIFQDNANQKSILTTMVSRKECNDVDTAALPHIALIYSETETPLSLYIKENFAKSFYKARSSSLSRYKHQDDERVIILADLERHVLATLQEEELKSLKRCMESAKSIIWVTAGGLLNGKSPESALSLGLARTLTLEQLSLDLITIDVDTETCTNEKIADTLLNLVAHQGDGIGFIENEYILDNGKIYISRLVPFDKLNILSNKEETLASIEDSVPLKGILKGRKILFQQDGRVVKPLKSDQVEIKVATIGLNKEDNLSITGSDYLPHFTHEIAGTIIAIGTDVQTHKVGDRVVGFCFDKCATNQRTLEELVQVIPDTASFEDMVTIPMAFSTALYGLQSLARVVTGETIIILNGGPAAIAALQICRFMGLRGVILTSSSKSIPKFQQLGVSKEELICIDNNDLSMLLKVYTNGHGIDVVFGTDYADATILAECSSNMAPFARFVTFGRRDPSRPFSSITSSAPGFMRFAFDIVDLYEQRPAILSKLLKRSLEIYNAAKFAAFKPVSISSVSEIETAIRSYSDDSSDGKGVISLDPKSLLKIIPSAPRVVLSPDSTYLLIGCLGGLGRSLTSWMVERGAKRLAFISRSGTDNRSAALLVENIKAQGVEVTVLRCDITSKSETQRVLKQINSKYPVRGVINAAMALGDGLFRNMTLDRWMTPLHAKVQGSKNLHEIFQDQDLEFFIMTSSVSGTIGTPGQSNYAAANTYLDALACHRRHRGLHGVSVVLPMILGVGYVSAHEDIEEKLQKRGMYGIFEEDFIAAFEIAILPDTDPIDHMMVGLDPTRLARVTSSNVERFWLEKPRFRTLASMMTANGSSPGNISSDSIAGTIKSLQTKEEAVAFVTKCLLSYFSDLLLIDEADFMPNVKSVASYGLDSMIGADVRNWIFREFHLDMSFQELLLPTLTITKLAEKLLEKFKTIV